jgi:chorismate synthase
MANNSFGIRFCLTTFGESHGEVIGGVVDGCPAGITLSRDFIQEELSRRCPGQSPLVSSRKEDDHVQFLSGLLDNTTTGAPIGFIIANKDVRSDCYEKYREVFRPGHADFTYYEKYGVREYRGSGRASARETAVRVVAGAIARQALMPCRIFVQAYISQIGNVIEHRPYTALDLTQTSHHPVCTPSTEVAQRMEAEILAARAKDDSIGGVITCVVKGLPAGVGEPIFDKLHARLAYAMLSIPAAKGFDIGSGFTAAAMRGSEHNDPFTVENGKITTVTNHAGGVLGGISTGNDIYFRVAFKPASSIGKEQQTITTDGKPVTITIDGRHDPCVVLRALPVVEAMTAITLLDMLLIANKLTNSFSE